MYILMTNIYIKIILVICLYISILAAFILVLSTYTRNILKVVAWTLFISIPVLLLIMYVVRMQLPV